ncbi:hypothetical protein QIU19_00430 [Capnocytophaga canimorsus]|nr:hypothetical protein [Capnocytophaga canimorsus]WGU68534.1 hypothetical protein QIU19_00430 [Capnocytophaga canimorsus]
MNTVTEKIEQFLTQHPDNHVCVSQGGRRLGKTTMPKYSFTLADIENIYGTVTDFVKSLPENGFVSDVKINLRSVTGFGASQRTTVKETLTLNFKKRNAYARSDTTHTRYSYGNATTTTELPVCYAYTFFMAV